MTTATLQFHLLSNPPTYFLTEDMPGHHTVTCPYLQGWVPEHHNPRAVGHLRAGVYTSLSLQLPPSHDPTQVQSYARGSHCRVQWSTLPAFTFRTRMDRFSKLWPIRIFETISEYSVTKLSIQLYICKEWRISDRPLGREGQTSASSRIFSLPHPTPLNAFPPPFRI